MNRKFLWIILLFFPFMLLFSQEETPKEETEEIKGKYKGKIEEKEPTLDINFDPYNAVTSYIGAEGFIYPKTYCRGIFNE